MAAIRLFIWHLDHGYAAAMATSVKSAREKLAADGCPEPALKEVQTTEPAETKDFREAAHWSWAGP